MNNLSASANLSAPAFVLLMPVHANVPASAFLGRTFSIFHVLTLCGVAKVFYPVIRVVTVDVVNDVDRPDSMHVEPRQPMRLVHNAVDSDSEISGRVAVASLLPWDSLPTDGLCPDKGAGKRVIVDDLAESFGCNIAVSHDAFLRS